jgi:hypothetical protein
MQSKGEAPGSGQMSRMADLREAVIPLMIDPRIRR